MSLNYVSLPIEYFPDPTKGRPVYNGSVFIGQPDLDPEVEANRLPVTVEEGDGTTTVIPIEAQPLTTGAGGVIMYNGSAVTVKVEGNYSLKVLNSQGAQVYYVEDVLDGVPIDANELYQLTDIWFDTVADMTSAVEGSMLVGVTLATRGYYAAGDGGGATYLVSSPQAVDGYSDHLLNNGNAALLQVATDNIMAQWGASPSVDNGLIMQAAWDKDPKKAQRWPAGNFPIQTAVELLTTQGGGFESGAQIIGAGFDSTAFDNQVSNAPMIRLGATNTGDFLMGATLRGFKIHSTVGAAQVGIKIDTLYQAECDQIWITGLDGIGIEIPTVLGDLDGSNMLSLDHTRIDNCTGWGIKADGSSGNNELSFVRMSHVFILECGTDDAATIPPSGGMIWKGQILSMDQCAFVINENVGLYIPGGAGLAQNVYLNSTVFEHNRRRHFLTTGLRSLKWRNCQMYSNDLNVAFNGFEADGSAYTVGFIDIDGVTVRATAGNNAYTAFKISGANANYATCGVKNIVWDDFDHAGQSRYEGFKDKPTVIAHKEAAQDIFNSGSSAIIFDVIDTDIQDVYDATNGRTNISYPATFKIAGSITVDDLDGDTVLEIELYNVSTATTEMSVFLGAQGLITETFLFDFESTLGQLGLVRTYEIRAKHNSIVLTKSLNVTDKGFNRLGFNRITTQ